MLEPWKKYEIQILVLGICLVGSLTIIKAGSDQILICKDPIRRCRVLLPAIRQHPVLHHSRHNFLYPAEEEKVKGNSTAFLN